MTTLTTGGRRNVDLGRLDPNCPAPYHGTHAAYQSAKCRCPHAKEAKRLYKKRAKHGLLTPVLVDATGTRRRVQGMWALGHTTSDIIEETGGRFSEPVVIKFCRQDHVTPVSRDLIAAAYQVLINRPGRSSRTRDRARAAGYALPIQWGADIDDPAAVPEPLEPEPLEPDDVCTDLVDEAVVERALEGERVELTDAELIAALQAGTARGEKLSTVAARLGVNHVGAKRMVTGELTPQRAKRARIAEALRRDFSRTDSALAAELGVHHTTVANVRRHLFPDRHQVAS
ncbi:hypothetical protein Ade02nite_19170 [Paractinoplanes deccanensis]|uniref:Uncharacterized protein n=1 Tax=Paractinoplanes deccanensis TaxID=113561 RepID=A0ABQ3XZU5_9ACTN|nr:hypothetical protein [Actinoplanes deccanensis]GID73276.1 hypothetical protein Ade02nite_19170 [Actinoplanes deccanensis]